ncbi:MAG: nucleotidyltransferase domain-containing protein [bacterium]
MKRLKILLLRESDIVFAYLFGSFLDGLSFRDIDIGIYLNNIKEEEVPIDIIDVKVLNFAPNSFLNSIFKYGRLILPKMRSSSLIL